MVCCRRISGMLRMATVGRCRRCVSRDCVDKSIVSIACAGTKGIVESSTHGKMSVFGMTKGRVRAFMHWAPCLQGSTGVTHSSTKRYCEERSCASEPCKDMHTSNSIHRGSRSHLTRLRRHLGGTRSNGRRRHAVCDDGCSSAGAGGICMAEP
ncbi:hypothetical protein H310_14122 [Aphanomyces invadans]|uniref:Uncharacterized protein n=1 Tax=Aphanomyces invadans TaxID=157072 RepID=A0A024TAY7_9STRA|nr:hypothetical protein H310_14122 [Aphanomyces invadans]ETV91300.1 hypothetical protein H310_14122 [Aphanomyces invadans]|eukprot:XP_008880137.1 hypothetical protein H310_14122 [Aphanomyces invadans]